MELDGKQPDATPSGISPHETQCLYKGRKEGGPQKEKSENGRGH